jgi:hypothetical protein
MACSGSAIAARCVVVSDIVDLVVVSDEKRPAHTAPSFKRHRRGCMENQYRASARQPQAPRARPGLMELP